MWQLLVMQKVIMLIFLWSFLKEDLIELEELPL